jgi:hypothetical protein
MIHKNGGNSESSFLEFLRSLSNPTWRFRDHLVTRDDISWFEEDLGQAPLLSSSMPWTTLCLSKKASIIFGLVAIGNSWR